MSLDALQFGPGGLARFTGSSGRSMTSSALGTVRYPSPFFDIAHMYLPSSFKQMLKWCRYYFLTNPLINSVAYKMAEYPITDLIFDTNNRPLYEKWSHFFRRTLKYKKTQVEIGLDRNVYGNCFLSIYYPFRKYLRCKRCGREVRVEHQKYVFRSFNFVGDCKCGHYGEFEPFDVYIRSAEEIRLIRWNPEFVTILHNDATGENEYYYQIPASFANDIRMGKRHVIEKVPQIFIDALKDNKALKFANDNIFHWRRPTISQKDKGWGLPMLLPVLKDAFYLQVLRKAQEAIGLEHIVPLRIIFPNTSSASADPYSSVNLTNWKKQIETEILRWRLDNNYIPVMPLPVGQQTLGGDGKALNLAQEYRVWSEQIVVGLGVPQEFAFGGLAFSGSSVSMRMLENHFLEDRANQLELVTDFIMPRVGAFMGWDPVPSHFRRFKMADDLQRNALYLQMNQAGKLSDKAMLEEQDWDYFQESEQVAKEQDRTVENQRKQALAQAAIQGEAQLTMAKYQARAQKMMQEMAPQQPMAALPPAQAPQGQASPGQAAEGQMAQPGQVDQGQMGAVQSPLDASQQGAQMDLMAMAQQIAAFLDQLPDMDKAQKLNQLQQTNPQLHALVQQMLEQRRGAHENSAAMPAPQQKPPRRGPEAAMAS